MYLYLRYILCVSLTFRLPSLEEYCCWWVWEHLPTSYLSLMQLLGKWTSEEYLDMPTGKLCVWGGWGCVCMWVWMCMWVCLCGCGVCVCMCVCVCACVCVCGCGCECGCQCRDFPSYYHYAYYVNFDKVKVSTIPQPYSFRSSPSLQLSSCLGPGGFRQSERQASHHAQVQIGANSGCL